jgi:shikimate dehydrogenase
MHTAALAELGLGERWSYEAIEVAPESFEALVRSLPDDDFAGANVTVPHKLAALALADRASEAARAIGAANTLSFTGPEIAAENTDAAGILGALGEVPAGTRALVLGAGGSARAAVWALREAGAEVTIWNRTRAKAEGLAQEFGAVAAPANADWRMASEDFGLVLNATTVGLAEANAATHGRAHAGTDLKALPVGADALSERHVVVDLVYGSNPTSLVAIAESRGARVVDGLDVLVHQGAASLRIWTGAEPPLQTMRRAARGN